MIEENEALVPLPPNRKSVGCKWVFKLKKNLNGSVNRYKYDLLQKEISEPVVKAHLLKLS